MERKRELEALVNKAEALNNEADAEEEEILINPHAASYRQSNYQRKAATSSRVAPEPASNKDFPNESWLEPLSWEQSNPKQSRTRSETARSAVNNQPTDGNYSIEELEGLLEQANRDQVSISQKSQAQFRKPVIKSGRISSAAPVKSKKLLKEDLELLIEKKRALKAGAGTGIVDETTLNIAIRLLKAGKEIHVVARKLDLSLAQVRLLDKNLRGESVAADEFEDTQHSNNSETFSPLHESIELESYDISAERELEDRNEVRGFKNQLRAYK
jgi:hypothetical protein